MTSLPPDRLGSEPDGWPARFYALARQSRSAHELLSAVLQCRLVVHLYEPNPAALSERGPAGFEGEEPVAVGHLLIDSMPPYPTLAVSAAVVLPARLPPATVRPIVTGRLLVADALEAVGAFWSMDLLRCDRLTIGESTYPFDGPDHARLLRLTRRLAVAGSPVAEVVDEILIPPVRKEVAQHCGGEDR